MTENFDVYLGMCVCGGGGGGKWNFNVMRNLVAMHVKFIL